MNGPIKKKMWLGITVLVLGWCLIPAAPAAALEVTVSIPPQKYFAKAIGGERVKVTVMLPAGASPATYEPKPRQMAALSRSAAYFAVGAPFERAWLPRMAAANPRMLMVHTEAQAPRVAMEAKHGHGHGHGHHSLDPHIWLAPRLVITQAKAMRDALVKLDPAGAKTYAANFKRFEAKCLALDAELAAAFRGLGKNKTVLVYHPAWGYFCRAYGLKQAALEKEGKEPGPAGLMAMIRQAKALGAKVVFVQPQFSQKSARLLARSIGGRVVGLDPLAPYWAANLKKVAKAVAAALEKDKR